MKHAAITDFRFRKFKMFGTNLLIFYVSLQKT